MRQRSYRTRIALAVIGILVGLVGLAAWSLETEYGGNGVGGSETSGGITKVFDIDEGSVDEEGHPVTTIVFEGTESEANAYMDRRWREGRSYALPGVIVAAGVLIFAGSLIPARDRE